MALYKFRIIIIYTAPQLPHQWRCRHRQSQCTS